MRVRECECECQCDCRIPLASQKPLTHVSSREPDLGAALGELLRSRLPLAGSPVLPVCGSRGGDGAGVPESPVLPGL